MGSQRAALTARRGAQAAHLDNIKREVAVLARLRGTLNVVHFKRAYEDASHVHIVMEARRSPKPPPGRNVPVVLLMLTSPGPHDHLCQIMPGQHLLQQLQARAGHSACSNFRMARPLRKRQGAQNRGHRRDRPAAGSSH